MLEKYICTFGEEKACKESKCVVSHSHLISAGKRPHSLPFGLCMVDRIQFCLCHLLYCVFFSADLNGNFPSFDMISMERNRRIYQSCT